MSADADPLDRFIPRPDVRERFEVTVRAPAGIVMAEARNFDMRSPRLVRTVFRLRERLMGASPSAPRQAQGLLAETRSLGWGLLAEEQDRLVICGAACQPWLADVKFTAISPERFAEFAAPEQVKIAWTLEAKPLAPTVTRFAQETRVVATDALARARFRRYWRWARFGIIGIRLLLLPAVRRAAEQRWAGEQTAR
jgi:hypothetical protein